MAGFLELIDNTLGTHFNTPVYDKKAGRKKMVREIDKAATQHKEGKTKVPHRAWSVGNNDAISYTPKLNGQAILIGDKETNYVPKDRFAEFLAGFKAAVENGDFDDQIEAALEDVNKLSIPRKRAAKGTGSKYPADHPATVDPEKWASMSQGEKIKAGNAYNKR